MQDAEHKVDLVEELERAVVFFRRGQNAAACLAWRTFRLHTNSEVPVIEDCIARGDWLFAADMVEQALLPKYRNLAREKAA